MIIADPEDQSGNIHDPDYVNVYYDYFHSERERLLPLRLLLPLLLLRLEDTGVYPKVLFPTFEPKP